MTAGRGHDVRRTSIRVALATTGVVGAAYLAVAIAVVAIVTGNLTAQVDARLADNLRHVPREPFAGDEDHFEPPPPDRPYGPVLLVWTVKRDDTIIPGENSPSLPASLFRVTGPETVTLNGVELRVQGAPAGDDYVVVAQTMQSVSEARSTVILAELVIGPALLLVVFLGAIAVGRRVATPVELARRRQLEFTADASHELRTPLSVIEANASLALAHDRPAAWYRAAFERVDAEARRMRRLVDDLLWLARFDATQAPPPTEPVDLGVLASQAADRFSVVAEARRLRLEVGSEGDGLVVAGSPEWLDRLLGVLLDNACKYAPDDGTVAIAVTAAGGRVRLTVDDSGPGISEDERSRIFDRFHRATDAKGGAGLGLAIADAVVQATGGHWLVATSPAGGARMQVSWPQAPGGSRHAAGSAQRGAATRSGSAGARGGPMAGSGEPPGSSAPGSAT
jgi:two-component system sensor histidine kinase CiaH